MTTNTTIHVSTSQITAEKSGGSDGGFGFESFNGFYYSLAVDDDREVEGSINDFASEFVSNCLEATTNPCYEATIVDDSEIGPLPAGPNQE